MATENHKRNYVHLGGFAVWIAATTLMMLHNGESTFARATTDGMAPLRALVEAGLTVLTIEATGLYFLWAATKADITPKQRRVAGWSVGLSVALGFAINLLGGLAGAEHVLNIVARVAQGVCLVLIARWHWVGNQVGESLDEKLRATEAELQQTQASFAHAGNQAGVLVAANERLQHERDAALAQLDQQQVQHEAELREVARLATAQRVQPAQLTTATVAEDWPQRALQLAQQAVANGEKPNWTAIGNEVGQLRQTVTKRVKPLLEVTQ